MIRSIKMNNNHWYIFVVMLFLSSCLGEDKNETTDNCTFDIGQQQLTSISKTAFPYENIKNVTFVDSLGIKKVFEVKYVASSVLVTNSITVKDTVFNGIPYAAGKITNCMFSQSWSYNLSEIGGSLILVARIYNDFDTSLPAKKVVDEIEILITDNGRLNEVLPYFNMRLDTRESQDGYADRIETKDEMTLFGKTFKGVINNVFNIARWHKAYYNKSEGIVAFTEANGRKWRFDSMQ
jgi:hypothetical protein